MSLRQLKWITVAGPVLFVLAVEVVRAVAPPGLLHAWPTDIVLAGVVLFVALVFSETIFGFIERMQGRLAKKNRELLALHAAGLDVTAELSLEVVLQKVVDQATHLLEARYGALSVPGEDGGPDALTTAGVSAEDWPTIGPASLLEVPIVSRNVVLGNLYVADKMDGTPFSQDDRDTLVRFATQAALAIDNARLHQQVRELAIAEERERIAREMHDSLAQVLGYVNTKAQAVQELLRNGQTQRADMQVGQLGEAARAAYADVREGILALRTTLGPERDLVQALEQYVDRWREQTGVEAELVVEADEGRLETLAPPAELQLLRIVQEALANVRKHASATHVWVRINETLDSIETIVEDNGRGFPGRSRSGDDGVPHFGLATMRERAESVGGRLEIDSTRDLGTRVSVLIPRGN